VPLTLNNRVFIIEGIIMNMTKYELIKENVFLKLELNKLKRENNQLKKQLDNKNYIPFFNIFKKTKQV